MNVRSYDLRILDEVYVFWMRSADLVRKRSEGEGGTVNELNV